ncbi:MAG: PAS domain S-box protein [candidate division Zixibacteria bacterium]|nr:PAS domain S-box protein [candidate division Zixibacteria bacterium]
MIFVAAVFVVTWIGINGSRSDSLELLVLQGEAFSEALAQTAENTIVSEDLIDYFVHRRFHEIAVNLADRELRGITEDDLLEITLRHDIFGAFIFDSQASKVVGASVRGPVVDPPDFVVEEVRQLLANPEENYVLLLDEGEFPDETVHFYLEISNQLDRVVLLVADALHYTEALRQTEIGALVQKMAMEQGVEYVIYQTTEGVVFSSRKTNDLPSIETDPFLTQALESDAIMHRILNYQDRNVLEMVRPFSSARYQFGLLRVGLSLEGYYAVSRGFDTQMIMVSGVLAILLLVALLYLNSRHRRKQIGQEFRQIKSVTDKIFEEMRTGVAAVGPDGAITLANQAFCVVFGLSDAVGKSWDSLTDHEAISFARLAKEAGSNEKEIELTRNGQSLSLLIATSTMSVEGSDDRGVVAVVYDISRLKEFELKASRRERLSEMGNLAAGVAHEIRNPLNAISIAAQRLSMEFMPEENAEEYQSFTRQIREETRRLNEIITRFLTLAREQSARRIPVRLDTVLGEQLDLLRLEAEKADVNLSVQIEPDTVIDADPDQIKQAFANLFTNALEAIGGNGGRIDVEVRVIDHSVQMLFSDDGPGIPAEIHQKVFSPYFTTRDAGTGLGLATVYKVISELDGEIRIEESEWGGARFVITLPVSTDSTE